MCAIPAEVFDMLTVLAFYTSGIIDITQQSIHLNPVHVLLQHHSIHVLFRCAVSKFFSVFQCPLVSLFLNFISLYCERLSRDQPRAEPRLCGWLGLFLAARGIIAPVITRYRGRPSVYKHETSLPHGCVHCMRSEWPVLCRSVCVCFCVCVYETICVTHYTVQCSLSLCV